jgi:hypothetical protein
MYYLLSNLRSFSDQHKLTQLEISTTWPLVKIISGTMGKSRGSDYQAQVESLM